MTRSNSEIHWSSGCARLMVIALLTSCGARTPLWSGEGDAQNGGAGGDASTPSIDAGFDSTPNLDASADTALDVEDAVSKPACLDEDPATWDVEHYQDDGDYDRAVAATSGVPWVAFNRSGGNIVLQQLSIDQTGIVVQDAFELPQSPVYPLALDVNDDYFVILTASGINWNGDLELWSVNRADGSVLRELVGQPPSDPAYTASAVLGMVGNDIVIAYGRLIDDLATLEVRNAGLDVQSAMTLDDSHLHAVSRGLLALDIYSGTTSVIHVEPGSITSNSVDPTWQLLGGLNNYLVQYDDQIRMIRGEEAWLGPWPHTQISPPAVVRERGDRAVFSLNTELTGVVGYPWKGSLEWMSIEPGPGASGIGVALMPVLQEGRMGLFYLGLEIPHPEQPLRYFGRVCHGNLPD